MEKFAFVILNYQSTDETVKCIESIQKIDYEGKYIIVVDNDSDNQEKFFAYLKKAFQGANNIIYLKSFKNLGYAQGNNIGIDYAKCKLKADFVCVINPDVNIKSRDFIEKSIDLYREYKYTVLGPRIVKQGKDSNPLMGYNESVLHCLYSWIENYRIYFIKKYNLKKYNVIKKKQTGKQTDLKGKSEIQGIFEEETFLLHKDMKAQLSGACLIFSPIFLKEFNGFCKDTFLYCEECIVAFICYNLGYDLLYSSALITEHEGGKSLINIEDDSERRQMQVSKAGAHSCMVETKIFMHKNNRMYLRKCLRPDSPKYCEV